MFKKTSLFPRDGFPYTTARKIDSVLHSGRSVWPGCGKQDDALVNLGSQYPISPPSRVFYQQQTKVFKSYRLTLLGQCCGDGLEAKRFFTWKGKALKKEKRLFENISSIKNFPPRICLATWPSRFFVHFLFARKLKLIQWKSLRFVGRFKYCSTWPRNQPVEKRHVTSVSGNSARQILWKRATDPFSRVQVTGFLKTTGLTWFTFPDDHTRNTVPCANNVLLATTFPREWLEETKSEIGEGRVCSTGAGGSRSSVQQVHQMPHTDHHGGTTSTAMLPPPSTRPAADHFVSQGAPWLAPHGEDHLVPDALTHRWPIGAAKIVQSPSIWSRYKGTESLLDTGFWMPGMSLMLCRRGAVICIPCPISPPYYLSKVLCQH